MGWELIWILYAVSLIICLVGFKKYVYFLSIGYGFSVAGIGVALAIMGLTGTFNGMGFAHYIMCLLFVAYGVRLAGFLLVREIKNASYRKTLKEVTGEEKSVPVFVKFFMWILCAALYVAQTSSLFFRLYNGNSLENGAETSTLMWVGIAVSAVAIILESVADRQKSAQKKERPDMVATKGLYKIVRCPNYFAEILFWTGVTLTGLDTVKGAGQWITILLAYVCIVYIMFNGAERLEKRQLGRYGNNKEYNDYANSTPIIIPFLPIYHLAKKDK
ncbi:MAG: DUF1295 domain-containing protein [Lachnospiraceae bacterium]|nr:DUF1295 domain-containing protein [Lachnospiraceae bacterium]